MQYELYTTNDGNIAKYVHNDGSETSIKTWPKGMESCGGSGRQKFNVFISVSVGCQIKCGFCFLTSKKYPYFELSKEKIIENVTIAIKAELIRRPELVDVPINFSFMGMGDAWLKLQEIPIIIKKVLKEVEPLIKSIEGVDIGTSLPQMNYRDKAILREINNLLIETNKLTDKPENRTHVRVFYSLHSMYNGIRKRLIPHTLNVNYALEYLDDISSEFNVIYHYIFFEYFNDHLNDISALVDYFSINTKQLRILRFNKCKDSLYNESSDTEDIIDTLIRNIPVENIKVQLSPGQEISAACGMFLMKTLK